MPKKIGKIERSAFFPRASERRVLPIVVVCQTSSHLHIFSSSHLLFTSSHLHIFSSSDLLMLHPHIFLSSHPHIFTSSHLHICLSSHLHIFSSAHLHIFSSSHLLIFTSSHPHIFSSLSSHLHIFSSSHLLIFTSSHPHIFTSSHPHIFTSEPRQKPISFAMSLGYAYAGACALLTRTQCYLTRQQWEKTSLRGAYALGNRKNDTSPQVLLTPPLVFTVKYVCSISVVRMKKS